MNKEILIELRNLIDEFLELIEEQEEVRLNQVKINGIWWDKFNTGIEEKEYFTFDEAQQLAKLINKRLPTEKEFVELIKLGYEWDNKGVWIGKDCILKENSNQSIFFPAYGYRYTSREAPTNIGSYGYYWSSTPSSAIHGSHLYFNSSSVFPQGSYYRASGFAVRCVQD